MPHSKRGHTHVSPETLRSSRCRSRSRRRRSSPRREIKLATLAPANTSWHKALLDMGNTWNKDTAGRVTLTVYPGGIQGDEATIVKKMRPGIDTLQALVPDRRRPRRARRSFNVFAMPFFFESDEEELAVEKKLTPLLEQRLQAKGFHLLSWGTGGWVQVFSKKPLRTLADVKAAKLFTTKGADKWSSGTSRTASIRWRCCRPTSRRS